MTQVLLMSNDPIFKSKSVEVITRAGFNVTDVSDAFEGLLRVGRDSFSTIIIDEELADIDGYKAFEKTRKYTQVPLILLGTESPEDVWARVNRQKFDVYIKKPVSPGNLVEQIKIAVQSPYLDSSEKVGMMAETAVEIPIELKDEEKAAISSTEEPPVLIEEIHPITISHESNQRADVLSHTESIEAMIADLERRVLKIKTAITKIDQLRGTIVETKAVIHQQQQDLSSLENKLQEINDQLKGILSDSDMP